jgi:hypothetical protein
MTHDIIDLLHSTQCSLVVSNGGRVATFYKKGVRDLEDLLNNDPEFLKGACIADKVTGKAAAGMAAVGGVKEIYADVMSRKAVPLLEENHINYSCGTMVDAIVVPAGDTRCPLEIIVEPASTAQQVVDLLKAHFAEMQNRKMKN